MAKSTCPWKYLNACKICRWFATLFPLLLPTGTLGYFQKCFGYCVHGRGVSFLLAQGVGGRASKGRPDWQGKCPEHRGWGLKCPNPALKLPHHSCLPCGAHVLTVQSTASLQLLLHCFVGAMGRVGSNCCYSRSGSSSCSKGAGWGRLLTAHL